MYYIVPIINVNQFIIEMALTNCVQCIIYSCLDAGNATIPHIRTNDKTMPGWSDKAKAEREDALFWHWIWCEAGRPYSGNIYAIMENTRHKYHYTVRRLKKEKINIKNRGLQKHHVIVNYFGIILIR